MELVWVLHFLTVSGWIFQLTVADGSMIPSGNAENFYENQVSSSNFPMAENNTVAPPTDGHCIWYGVCNYRYDNATSTYFAQNCPYNGTAKPLTSDAMSIFKSLCPRMVEIAEKEGTCCDVKQLGEFNKQMALPRELLLRCPSCFYNFADVWCWSTCYPRQSQFLKVDKVEAGSPSYISAIDYFITRNFGQRLKDSCAAVTNPQTNQPALPIICGQATLAACTLDAFFQYMGNNYLAPFSINYSLSVTDKVVVVDPKTGRRVVYSPMNDTTYSCTDAATEQDLPCSCSDCKASCVNLGPYPSDQSAGCRVGSMNCLVFSGILIFLLVVVIVSIGALHCVSIGSGTPLGWSGLSNQQAGQVSAYDHIGDEEKVEDRNSPSGDGRMDWLDHVRSGWERMLERSAMQWGVLCVQHPVMIISFGLIVCIAMSCGWAMIKIITDPVDLWSASTSRARTEKDYFDTHFGPFYRTEQLIIVPHDASTFNPVAGPDGDPALALPSNDETFGPVFRLSFLNEIFDLQDKLLNLEAPFTDSNGTEHNITLADICFKPLGDGGDPSDVSMCTVESPLQWFQNSRTNLNKQVTNAVYQDFNLYTHIHACLNGPLQPDDNTPLHLGCLGDFGGPAFPYVALGGIPEALTDNPPYQLASALIINIINTNHDDPTLNRKAEAWEKVFIEFIQNFTTFVNCTADGSVCTRPGFNISYSSERSITDEIARESQSEALTIAISYIAMFVYIAIALGHYHPTVNPLYLFVGSKMTLGIVGVLIVALAVVSSIGFFLYCGVAMTLIVFEVVPFLVLAVGTDNIFIFVQAYQRNPSDKSVPLERRIGVLAAEVIPSMMLTSLSEISCFLLGAMSGMPAVRSFSLYAGLAIFFDFFLQITVFLPVFAWDVRREEANRPEPCCCIKLMRPSSESSGLLRTFVKEYFAPFIMILPVRIITLLNFCGIFCIALSFFGKVEIGLDQSLSMPKDSYVLDYFNSLNKYLSVGAPVYFVVKGKADYSNLQFQNGICGSAGCEQNSLDGIVKWSSGYRNQSYIAHPVSNWLDDYLSWLRPFGDPPCCRLQSDNATFCPSTDVNDSCHSCNVPITKGRPPPVYFHRFLHDFLEDNPNNKCAVAGHAAYGQALHFDKDGDIDASYFMTYHRILQTSGDYIAALLNAREISDNITKTIRNNSFTDIEVFPYSVFYVFYEQYLTVVHDTGVSLAVSLAAIFVVTFVFLGIDPWSALLVTGTIAMILVDMIGMMAWWHISLNAVSLVNLVMTVGISVEFCSHIARAFVISQRPTRALRATEALSTMGASVFSGITLTKFIGIIVLAFSQAQLFQVFYFRMYMGIVLFGASHGLVFLPVLLSFLGPPRRKTLKADDESSSYSYTTMLDPQT